MPCSLSSNREPRNPRTREPKPKTQIRSPGFVFSINHYANSLSGCPIKPQTARTSQIYGRLNNLPDPSKSLARTKTPNSVQNCWGKSREIAKTIKYRLAGIQEQQHPASPANESKRMQIKIFPLSRRLQDSQLPLHILASPRWRHKKYVLVHTDVPLARTSSTVIPNPRASGILCIGESLY